MEKLRWGIMSVSAHYALRVHLPLSRLGNARILALASRDEARAEAAARRLGIPRAHSSYEALLADPEIDAVYLPLPNQLHAPWGIRALEAGKHVLCEKPLAMDAAEAAGMAAAAERSGRLLMEAFMYRFHPQWLRAREIVASGELGRLRSVQVSFSYNNPDPANIRNRVETGGGALYDIGCYAVSAARWLFGAEPTRVLSHMERGGSGTDILTTGILDFGASAGSARSSFTVATRSHPAQRVEVLGEKGQLALALPFNAHTDVPCRLEVTTGLGARIVETGPADQYALLFGAFSAAALAGEAAPTPVSDAVANMSVLDALFRSARSGAWEGVGA